MLPLEGFLVMLPPQVGVLVGVGVGLLVGLLLPMQLWWLVCRLLVEVLPHSSTSLTRFTGPPVCPFPLQVIFFEKDSPPGRSHILVLIVIKQPLPGSGGGSRLLKLVFTCISRIKMTE